MLKTHDMHKCQDTAGCVLQGASISLRKQMTYTHVNKKTRPHYCQNKANLGHCHLKRKLYHHNLAHIELQPPKLPYLNTYCHIYFREQDVSCLARPITYIGNNPVVVTGFDLDHKLPKHLKTYRVLLVGNYNILGSKYPNN